MIKKPVQVKFQNSQNPNAEFDLIELDDLLNRKYFDHSPYELHLVNFYLIILIETGKGQHMIDFTNYQYEKGSLFTIRKDQIHKFYENRSVKGVLLLFTNDFLVSYLEKLVALESMQLFNEVIGVPKIQLSKTELTEISNLLERVKREYFKINDEYSLGIIRSELQILIAKLYRIKSNNKEIIVNRKYLSEFIEFQNLIEKNATKTTKVRDYAKMTGVSTKTLNNITNHIVNKSAKEFVDEICTKQIKRLLINTDFSIKEIAYTSGFEETTNFYKYFKRQTEFTPEQFRNTFR